MSSALYTIPYLSVLTIFLICAFWEYRSKNRINHIRVICITTFLLFFGLRGFVGWDWTVYYRIFNGIQPIFTHNVWNNFALETDIGFIAYATIIKTIFADYHLFIFISVLIDIIILDWFVKKYSINYALSFAVFMSVSLSMEIDLLRNIKSIMVFMMALPAIENRKIVKYYLLNVIAILLHASAIVYLPLYFFLNKKFPRKIFISILVIGNIIFLLQIPIIKPILTIISEIIIGGRYGMMLSNYINSDIYASSFGLGLSYIERLLTMCMVAIYYDKILSLKPSNVLFVNLYAIYVIITLFFSDMKIIFVRGGLLFIFSYWIIWPALVNSIRLRNNKLIIKLAIPILLYLYVFQYSKSIMYRYDNILTGIDSYSQRRYVFDKYASDILNENTK